MRRRVVYEALINDWVRLHEQQTDIVVAVSALTSARVGSMTLIKGLRTSSGRPSSKVDSTVRTAGHRLSVI